MFHKIGYLGCEGAPKERAAGSSGSSIEFEVELGLGSTVVPVGQRFELAPPQVPFRECGTSDRDAHARRLPDDPAFLCDRFGRADDTGCGETWPAFVLAREDEDRIAFGDVLAAIHRLLRAERESFRPRIANLGFDREQHTPHFARSISMAVHGQGLTRIKSKFVLKDAKFYVYHGGRVSGLPIHEG